MDTSLVAALHHEEHLVLAQLRASVHFRRLEEIRRLLRLYDYQPPVGAFLDAMLDERRGHAPPAAANQADVILLGGERAFA